MRVPHVSLAAQFAASGNGKANENERTREVLFYAGATVIRGYDPQFKLTLGMKPGQVRMDRLLSGKAPVLDSHDTYSGIKAQIGVVETARIEKGRGYAGLRFSERDEVTPIWQDIQNGIIRNASVGAKIHKLQDVSEEDDKIKSYLAVDWEPLEISIVPIGADPDAGFRAGVEVQFSEAEVVSVDIQGAIQARKGVNMPDGKPITNAGEQARTTNLNPATDPATINAAAAVTDPPLPEADLEKVSKLGATKEKARVVSIRKTCQACGLEPSFGDRHIDADTSIEEFRRLAIDEKARRAAAQPQVTGLPAEIAREETEMRRIGLAGALLERFKPGNWRFDPETHAFVYEKGGRQKLFEPSRQFVGLTLLDVAKECLAAQGIRWQSRNRTEIAQLAFQSTSDFPGILANVANKSLRSGYEMYESQWRLIAARRTAPDFKTVSELTLDGSARLELIKEDGEYHRGKLVEGKETWQLATYGKIIGITRQAIINDDLGAFTRTPFLLGQEVAMLEADMVIGIITDNAALADGKDLFDATYHFNVTGSGAAISIASLGAARVLLMTQKLTGAKPLNITPRFLLAPATQGQLAEQYCSANYQATEQANINPLAGRLTPVIESRLDAGTAATAGDTYAWYLFGDPNSPNGTVVIYAYLEGQEGPYTENRQGFDIDGVEIKIRHDFAAASVDYRGAVKNAGH